VDWEGLQAWRKRGGSEVRGRGGERFSRSLQDITVNRFRGIGEEEKNNNGVKEKSMKTKNSRLSKRETKWADHTIT